jgi:hypothetical protein
MAQAAYRWQRRDAPEFRGERQPAWIRRLKKAWKANPLTSGDAPRALPLLVAMPLRTRKGFRRDCAAAWPEAEFVTIQEHTDVRRWLDRCAVSAAPAVMALCADAKRYRDLLALPDQRLRQRVAARPDRAAHELPGQDAIPGSHRAEARAVAATAALRAAITPSHAATPESHRAEAHAANATAGSPDPILLSHPTTPGRISGT